MYLSKLWREGRLLTIIAAVALLLMSAGILRFNYFLTSVKMHHPDPHQFYGGVAAFLIGLLYSESILVSFWGWLSASIGVGKNLGEDSGSYLLTRPRTRAWFLWSDWGYTMAQIAIIIAVTNLIFLLSIDHVFALMHAPAVIPIDAGSATISIAFPMFLISIAVLLAAGLIYGLSYCSTILIQRTSGVMLGAGILLGYFILRGILHHYSPVIHLPNLVMNIFAFGQHTGPHLAGSLAASIAARTAVVLAFPFAAQLLLNRAEI
ncbi:MAG TPA: hypothetical protein VMU92_01800 [Acidobacteriaceae bacterium]|nr:hypothetical protein [Acidobacteriaceae bacterium]